MLNINHLNRGGRDAKVDSAKGWLILLVILGHCLQLVSKGNQISDAIISEVYSFHIPAFVFLSGYFTKLKESRKFLKSTLKLFESFIVFQILVNILPSFLHHSISPFIHMGFALWYIFSLFVWRLSYFALSKCRINITIMLVASIILSVIWNILPAVGSNIVLQRIIAFAPYFFAGVCLNSKTLESLISKIPKILAVFILFSPVLFHVFFMPYPKGTLYGSGTSMMDGVIRLILIMWSSLMFISFYRVLKATDLFSYIGSRSLWFYLYHAIFVVAVKEVAIVLGVDITVTISLIAFAAMVCLIYFISRYEKFNKFMCNPITWSK